MGSIGHNIGQRVLIVTLTRQGFEVTPCPPLDHAGPAVFDHPCAALSFAQAQAAAWPDRFSGVRDEIGHG